MKELIVYIVFFFVIVFFIPALCIVQKKDGEIKKSNTEIIEKNEVEYSKYQYEKYANIDLYHKNSDSIENLDLDTYLYGVVSAEMPANYDIEALRAQAIVARTYTLYQIMNNKEKHPNNAICDDSKCCQAWISKEERMNRWEENDREFNWNKILEAVDSTSGKIITYEGNVIDAFFHANSGGVTEAVSNIWGGQYIPYLQSVETAGENEYSQYNSQVELTKTELLEKLKSKYKEIKIDFEEKECIKISEYTSSGRVKTLKIGDLSISGAEARTIFDLKSTNFSVEILEDKVIFSVIGYGHGVGMSQTGADSLAKNGSNANEIIEHFYKGVKIEDVNNLIRR